LQLAGHEPQGLPKVVGQILGMRDVLELAVEELDPFVPRDLSERIVDRSKASVDRHLGNTNGGIFENLTKALFVQAQLCFGVL